MLYSIGAGQVFLSSELPQHARATATRSWSKVTWSTHILLYKDTHIGVGAYTYTRSYEHTQRLVCARQMPTDAEKQEVGLSAEVLAEALVPYAVMRRCSMRPCSLGYCSREGRYEGLS